MPFIEKKIISGNLLEVEKYFATRLGKKVSRGVNENTSSQEQEDLNNRAAQKKLVRLINTNFNGSDGDLFVTLTYARNVDEETAKRESRNFFRRLRAYRKRNGLDELKYIVIHEKQGKWHHHLIINSLPLSVINELWGLGRVTVSQLDNTYNYKDLVNYLLKQEKSAKNSEDDTNIKEPRQKGARRWTGSRNLKQPTVKIREIKKMSKNFTPKAPKGYILQPNWITSCDAYGNLYQYYSCVKINNNSKNKRRKPGVL